MTKYIIFQNSIGRNRSKTCQDQWLRIFSLLSQLSLPVPWSHIAYWGPLLGYRTVPPNAPSWEACKSLGLDYPSILQLGVTCLSFHQILGVWKACIISQHPTLSTQYPVHSGKTMESLENDNSKYLKHVHPSFLVFYTQDIKRFRA